MSTATKSRKTASNGSGGYETMLSKAYELRGKAGLAVYELGKILVKLFDDMDYRHARLDGKDDFEVAEFLSTEFLDQLFLDFEQPHDSFFVLRDLITHYPDRNAWQNGELRKLYQTMIADKRASQSQEADEAPKPTRARASLKDIEEAKDEAKHFKARAAFIEKELDRVTTESKSELAQLREENTALREENAQLRGRIQELERVLSRELAAA